MAPNRAHVTPHIGPGNRRRNARPLDIVDHAAHHGHHGLDAIVTAIAQMFPELRRGRQAGEEIAHGHGREMIQRFVGSAQHHGTAM